MFANLIGVCVFLQTVRFIETVFTKNGISSLVKHLFIEEANVCIFFNKKARFLHGLFEKIAICLLHFYETLHNWLFALIHFNDVNTFCKMTHINGVELT